MIMLREIRILKDNQPIFERRFGNALTKAQFDFVWPLIAIDILRPMYTEKSIIIRYFHKYQFYIKCDSTKRLAFVFITDMYDSHTYISEVLEDFVDKFLNEVCATDANSNSSKKLFTRFLSSVDETFKRVWPKISLIGYSGVGKTTIRNLIQELDLPKTHIPTVSGEIVSYVDKNTGNFFRIWDYGGQQVYQNMWSKFLVGSDMVLIVTDSTEENCVKSVGILDVIKTTIPDAEIAIIANKQDLKMALPIKKISKIFGGLDVYPLIATDVKTRQTILKTISEIIKIDLNALQIVDNEIEEKQIEAACSLDEIEEVMSEPVASNPRATVSNPKIESKPKIAVAPNFIKVPTDFESLQRWIIESWDIIKWILQKAKNRDPANQWFIAKDWLLVQPDLPVTEGEFEIIYSHLAQSPLVEVKDYRLGINSQGKELLDMLMTHN
jgi:small GTP-binding protein